jgi:ribosome modulation factor
MPVTEKQETTPLDSRPALWVEGFLAGLGDCMACECPYPGATFQRSEWAAGFVRGRQKRNAERQAAWKAAPL